MSKPIHSDGDSPTAPPLRMPEGTRYAGQAIDASSRRSIVIHPPEGRTELIGPEDECAVVDYFYHSGQFWRAVIPLNATAEIFGQAFNFSQMRTKRRAGGREIIYDRTGLPKRKIPWLNHVQCRITLRPPNTVKLYPLGGPTTGAPTAQVDDFIYSCEVVGPPDVSFNLHDGRRGNLLNAHRFMSTLEMVFERIVVENQYVTESPAVPLSAEDKRALLVRALMRSHHADMRERYYLLRLCGTNNCTSNPLTLVDHIVDYGWRGRLGSLLYRMPLNPRFYLRIRGLDADPSLRKLVRNEFTEYIEAPATRQRKRAYVRQRSQKRRDKPPAH